MPAIIPVLFPGRFFLLSVFSDHSPLSYFLAVNRGSFAAIDFLCHLPSGDLLYLYSTGNRSLRKGETIEILTHAGYYVGDLNPRVSVYFLCVIFYDSNRRVIDNTDILGFFSDVYKLYRYHANGLNY